jgi:hypothetical protein
MSDQPILRCPRLGGEVTFGYCWSEGGDLPCQRILNCWQPFFPVEKYLREKLTPQQWERCFDRKPKEKICTLIELVEQAQRHTGQT